ncbi:hypothetical protein F2Q68_00004871 [Brassica cretica]|uniref:Uncharacterized protein n=1 Tax=Brassica cretica TaxID=69181 RepID=A0A8S9JCU6_BRACR|nr:hypothetical protein F2Q68_00004871 [Brassica cretica]
MVQDVHRSIIIFKLRGFSSVSIDGTGSGISKSINVDTKPMIDARLASFEDRLQSFDSKLDDVYYPLKDRIDSLTTRMDELKEEMDMIRRQNAI